MVANVCSRRSGKTVGFCKKWRRVAQAKPGFMTPYVGLTRQSAKNIIWPVVKELNRQLGWGLSFHETELRARDKNGSELYVIGANATEEIDKLRGFPVPLVGVDEAQSFRDSVLSELLDDVVGPGLADLEGDQWIMGTPGLVPAGYFYRATTGEIPGYDVHSWTYLDNPFLPRDIPGMPRLSQAQKRARREAYLAKWLSDRGLTIDSPTYRREWLGEWHRDTSQMVYALDLDAHVLESMPADYAPHRQDKWVHVVGIDFGYVDSTAWTVWAFRKGGRDQTCYAVESFARPGLTPSQAAEITRDLAARYGGAVLVGDSGGIGKGYIEEARARFGLQIEAADKMQKRAHIELMNDGYRGGRIAIVRGTNQQLIDETSVLQWDLKYPKDDPRWHTREDPRFSNHLPDAALYGWFRCHAWINNEPPPAPPDPEDRWTADDEREGYEDRPWWDDEAA